MSSLKLSGVLDLPDDDQEARIRYMDEFKKNMDPDMVMSYRWPTDHMSPQSNSLEEEVESPKKFEPSQEYPDPFPENPTPPVTKSVAGTRKFNVIPFQSDGFTAAVDAQRAGSGAPGLCGLGLTRDKTKFSNDTMTSSAQMAPHISNIKSVGSTRIGISFAEISPDTDEGTKGIAGMMFKVAGVQLLSGTMKEEERWRDVYRACLPPDSADPYEDGQDIEPLPGSDLSDKISLCEEGEMINESLLNNIENSPTLQAIREQPALQDALAAINDGALSPNEWIHFCDAVRDIVKWNEFAM